VLVRKALAAEDLSAFRELLDPAVTRGAPGARNPSCKTRDQLLASIAEREHAPVGCDQPIAARLVSISHIVDRRRSRGVSACSSTWRRRNGGGRPRWNRNCGEGEHAQGCDTTEGNQRPLQGGFPLRPVVLFRAEQRSRNPRFPKRSQPAPRRRRYTPTPVGEGARRGPRFAGV
jgi:hypothetical protein